VPSSPTLPSDLRDECVSVSIRASNWVQEDRVPARTTRATPSSTYSYVRAQLSDM